MHSILFTGGGSAGHVTPSIDLIQKFKADNWKVSYAGSANGIEKEIIERLGVPYFSVASGKLRRYFSWRTFFEPFLILLGTLQAFKICHHLKPSVVFSKGGFVAFPVVVGAWLNGIPVVIHESDLTPGLANRLSFPFANKICMTLNESKKPTVSKKIVVTGNPVRESLFHGSSARGQALCGFTNEIPIILVQGGGHGAIMINDTIRNILPALTQHFQIAHVCGKGKVKNELNNNSRYIQFEYVNEELADLFACCDLVISRAGANSLYELLRLKKPHILIPLSKKASRGDQIINAQYFVKKGLSNVIYEENLTEQALLKMINNVYEDKTHQKQKLDQFSLPDSNQLIYEELLKLAIT